MVGTLGVLSLARKLRRNSGLREQPQSYMALCASQERKDSVGSLSGTWEVPVFAFLRNNRRSFTAFRMTMLFD